jgi:hypothetical protein
MRGWQLLLDSAGVVLLLFICYGLLLVVRRRVLARDGGTFELSVRIGVRGRQPQAAGRGWVLGLGRYRDDRLEWFRIFSPSPRPRRSWRRSQLEITGQREPSGPEAFALYGGHLVVECSTPSGPLELAMSRSALTGFSSWLEAGPPGADWDSGRVR